MRRGGGGPAFIPGASQGSKKDFLPWICIFEAPVVFLFFFFEAPVVGCPPFTAGHCSRISVLNSIGPLNGEMTAVSIARNACTTGPIFWYFFPIRDRSLRHLPDKNVRSWPFYGDSSPFLPQIRQFFFLQKSEERILLQKRLLCMRIQLGCHRMSHILRLIFRNFTTRKVQHSCHCHSTEILVQARNIPMFSSFSTEKQTQATKSEKRNLDQQGQNFQESTKTEAGVTWNSSPKSAKFRFSSTKGHSVTKVCGRLPCPSIAPFLRS